MLRARGITLKLAVIFLIIGIVPMAIVGLTAYQTAKNSMTTPWSPSSRWRSALQCARLG